MFFYQRKQVKFYGHILRPKSLTQELIRVTFIDLIATAIKTAVTDYVPIAQQANYQAFLALPHGKYSKLHKLDQEVQIFNALKDKALDN